MSAPWVEALLKLQEVDLRIRDLETRMTLIPNEMRELAAKRDAASASTAAAADQIRKITRAIQLDEAEIKNKEEKIAKLRQQSAMVKKNNEYQAMLSEIALQQKQIGEIESRVLTAMDSLKHAKAEGRKLKAANDAVIKSAKAEFDELLSFSGEVKEEIARQQALRPAFAKGVDAATMARYTTLLNGKSGTPLVKIADGICENCHMRVTPQALSSIKKGVLTSCDNCMHLIYTEECIY